MGVCMVNLVQGEPDALRIKQLFPNAPMCSDFPKEFNGPWNNHRQMGVPNIVKLFIGIVKSNR